MIFGEEVNLSFKTAFCNSEFLTKVSENFPTSISGESMSQCLIAFIATWILYLCVCGGISMVAFGDTECVLINSSMVVSCMAAFVVILNKLDKK